MHKQIFDNLLQASKNLLNPHAQGNESESYVLKDRGLEKLKEDTKDIKLEEKEIKKDEKDEKEDDNLTQYSKNGSGSKMKNFMRIPSHPIQSIVESNNAQVNLDFFIIFLRISLWLLSVRELLFFDFFRIDLLSPCLSGVL